MCTTTTNPIGLLTIGNTGVGKSFIQNVLAGSAVFRSARQVNAVTTITTSHNVTLGEKEYKLFDIPGLIELANSEKIEKNKAAIEVAFSQCSEQIVLMVMSQINLRPQPQDVATFLAVHRAYELDKRSIIFVVNQLHPDDEELEKEEFQSNLHSALKESLADKCPDVLHVVFCVDIGRRVEFGSAAAQGIRKQIVDVVSECVAHAHSKKHAIDIRHAEMEQLKKLLEELQNRPPQCEHSWVECHASLLNQESTHEERHHTGSWGGFLHGWSCCGKGSGNFTWNHNDCHPRSIKTNRLICSRCGRDPSTAKCGKTCTLCGVATLVA